MHYIIQIKRSRILNRSQHVSSLSLKSRLKYNDNRDCGLDREGIKTKGVISITEELRLIRNR